MPQVTKDLSPFPVDAPVRPPSLTSAIDHSPRLGGCVVLVRGPLLSRASPPDPFSRRPRLCDAVCPEHWLLRAPSHRSVETSDRECGNREAFRCHRPQPPARVRAAGTVPAPGPTHVAGRQGEGSRGVRPERRRAGRGAERAPQEPPRSPSASSFHTSRGHAGRRGRLSGCASQNPSQAPQIVVLALFPSQALPDAVGTSLLAGCASGLQWARVRRLALLLVKRGVSQTLFAHVFLLTVVIYV